HFLESEKDPEEENLYSGNRPEDIYANTRMATVGASHIYLLNQTTFIRTIGSVSFTEDDTRVDSLDATDLTPHFFYSRKFLNSTYQLDVSLNKKLNARNKVKIGVNYRWLLFDMADKYYSSQSNTTRLLTGYNGSTNFMQAYAEWQFRATERLTFNTGLHGQYLVLNSSNAIEPRVGAKYQLAKKHYLGMAYGLHSQMAPMDIYFSVQRDNLGNEYNPNKNLDFTKSHHFVLSYDWNISNTSRFRSEVYYQYLFNTIIDQDSSFWALLNRTTFNDGNPDLMVNDGTGVNYGIELTLEQFMNRGFYGLLTSSIYRSTYIPSDGIERSTAFDSRYIVNLVTGKEFAVGKKNPDAKRKKWICLDGKISYAGGRRYIPIDEAQSTIDGELVWDEKNAFKAQFDPYFRADVRIAYRISGKKASQEWALDVQNVTNAQNPYLLDWNTATNEVEIVYQLGLFPVMQYKIEF
ncbi:MAG TPA: hypothetical protein DCX54_04590, partial [Flavobacteriales bacterium]|nr:hypothetical protein [Flavobacteriales bacterium]